MKRPRVLFLDHTGALGGAELFLLELAHAYGAGGQVVLFADGPFRERLERKGVPVELELAVAAVTGVGRGGGGAAQLMAIPGVLALARRIAKRARAFDLIFANSQKALVVGALAARLARKPLVWYLHDIVTAEHFSAVNRKLSVWLGNRFAARIISNSEASREAFVASGGRRDRLAVVYNGIDDPALDEAAAVERAVGSPAELNGETPTMAPQERSAESFPAPAGAESSEPDDGPGPGDAAAGPAASLSAAWANGTRTAAGARVRAELGLNGAPVVGVFSRVAPWKGQHVLLEAMRDLPAVHALQVGAPLFGDEIRYHEELKAKARQLGIADRVHFLGFREDVPELLQAVDVVAHTSVSPEPFGRVIVEGMLAGKPVVATNAGGAREIIEDGVTGRLVAPGDAKGLSRIIQEWLADPAQARTVASAGQAAARSRFSVKAMLDGITRELQLADGEKHGEKRKAES